jgi:nitrite reductase/ring-hydroxylating ferredoxin subunit
LVQRRRDNRDAGLTLSLIGLGLVSLSSWLGGDLSYDLGIGVDRNAFDQVPNDWVDVAAESDIQEGKPKRVLAEDYPVMLLKRGLEIQAIAATCPHLGAPLEEGEIDDDTVICPWHGSTFCLDNGSLIHGPATAPVISFDVMVEGGRVFVKARKPA